MPEDAPNITPVPAEAHSADQGAPLPPAPADAGLKPGEYGQYGMRAAGAVGHGSDYGAPTDHESFDDEYRTREERDHRSRSIPTGLSDAPNDSGVKPPAGRK